MGIIARLEQCRMPPQSERRIGEASLLSRLRLRLGSCHYALDLHLAHLPSPPCLSLSVAPAWPFCAATSSTAAVKRSP